VADDTHVAAGPCGGGSCPAGQTCRTRQACIEGVIGDHAASLDQCSDGFDNDGDGFIDCDDWDCNHNPDLTGGPCRGLVCP
jgi:hypothetical protein